MKRIWLLLLAGICLSHGACSSPVEREVTALPSPAESETAKERNEGAWRRGVLQWPNTLRTTKPIRNTSHTPPVTISISLGDSAMDWSVVETSRPRAEGATDETCAIELGSALMTDVDWSPIHDASREEGWASGKFKDGKNDVLEWKFEDKSNSQKQCYQMRFRLITSR